MVVRDEEAQGCDGRDGAGGRPVSDRVVILQAVDRGSRLVAGHRHAQMGGGI